MIKNSYVSSFKLGGNLSHENNLGESWRKIEKKNLQQKIIMCG
jgi:hypothetical protein